MVAKVAKVASPVATAAASTLAAAALAVAGTQSGLGALMMSECLAPTVYGAAAQGGAVCW